MITIIPTNTCYGIGCDAHDLRAFEEIYRIKDRSRSKALALLVRDIADIAHYISLSEAQVEDLRHYPHPWSIVGDLLSDAPLPQEIVRDPLYKTISLRTISDALPESIVHEIRPPLWLTSANRSGEREAHTIEEAQIWIEASHPELPVTYLDAGLCSGLGSNIFRYE